MSSRLSQTQRVDAPLSPCASPAQSDRGELTSEPARGLARRGEATDTVRRLNTALMELERIKAERNSFVSQTHALQLQCSKLERELGEQHKLNVETLPRNTGEPTRDISGSTRRDRHLSEPLNPVEVLQAALRESELSRLELAQANEQLVQDVSTLEMDRKKLLDSIQQHQDAALLQASQQSKAAGVHTRHSRLLASVTITDRVAALTRKVRASAWATLRSSLWRTEQRRRGALALLFAAKKKAKMALARRVHVWREETTKTREEADKSTLLRGFHMSLDQHTAQARLQSLAWRVAAVRRLAASRSRVPESVDRFLEKQAGTQTRARLLSVFLAWRGLLLSSKGEKLSTEAEGLKRNTAVLEEFLSREKSEHQQTLMIKAIRTMARQSRVYMWSHFAAWRKRMLTFKAKAPFLKRMLTIWTKSKEVMALSTWKATVGFMQIAEVANQSEKLNSENSVLHEHIANLEKVVQLDSEEKRVARLKRLRMAVRINWKLQVRAGLRRWAYRSTRAKSKMTACEILSEALRRHCLEHAWRLVVTRQQRNEAKELRLKKLMKYSLVSSSTLMRKVFTDWEAYNHARRFARKVVRKALTHSVLDDLRKGLLAWKDGMQRIKASAAGDSLTRQHQEKLRVEQRLAETEQQLAAQKTAMRAFRRSAQERCLAKMKEAAGVREQQRVEAAFDRWRLTTKSRKRRLGTSARLLVLWSRQQTRSGLRSWSYYVKLAVESRWRAEVKTLQRSFKEQRCAFKTHKEALEDSVAVRDKEMTSVSGSLQKTQREFQGVLGKLVRTKQSSVSKTVYCFEAWKRRTAAVRRTSGLLLSALKNRVLRLSLLAIRRFAQTSGREEWKRASVEGMLRSLTNCGLRTYTARWRNFTRWCREAELEAEVLHHAESLENATRVSSAIKEQLSLRLLFTSERQTQLRTLHAWRDLSSQLHRLRACTSAFHRSVDVAGLSRTLRTLRTHARLRRIRRAKCARLLACLYRNTKEAVFAAWAHEVKSLRFLHRTLCGVRKTHCQLSLRLAFERLSKHGEVVGKSRGWEYKMKAKLASRAAISLGKASLRGGFLRWKAVTRRVSRVKAGLKLALGGAKHRGLRKAWSKWVLMIRVEQQSEYEQMDGPVARARRALQDKLSLLRRVLHKEGVDLLQYERYLLERESKESVLTSVWTGNEVAGLPRFFLLWKFVFAKKHRLTAVAHRLRLYRRNPSLLHSFHVWKRCLPLYSPLFPSRRTLAAVMGQLEVQLDRAASESRVLGSELDSSVRYSRRLERLVRQGQNQSLCVLALRIRGGMLKAVSRWAQASKGQETLALKLDCEELERELRNATANLILLKSERMELVRENEELSQSTRDGVAYAEALESAEQETRVVREQLRERAEVIQRLVEENKHLAFKVRRLGEEENTSLRYSFNLRK